MRKPTSIEIAVAALFVVLALAAWANHDRMKRAEARVAAAEAQAALNGQTAHEVDRYHATTTVIREKAEEADRAVQAAPGADAPLDPAFRSALCDGLGRMRGGAQACAD